mgnify:CR=1 FL=1
MTFFWPFYGDYWVIGLDPDSGDLDLQLRARAELAANAVKAQPEIATFQFRAANTWVSGTHSRSSFSGFFGATQELQHRQVTTVEADHPEVLTGEDEVADKIVLGELTIDEAADPELIARGGMLAAVGDRSRGVPACHACHARKMFCTFKLYASLRSVRWRTAVGAVTPARRRTSAPGSCGGGGNLAVFPEAHFCAETGGADGSLAVIAEVCRR